MHFSIKNSVEAARHSVNHGIDPLFFDNAAKNEKALFAVEKRLVSWLEAEVKMRLVQIDAKLEEMSAGYVVHEELPPGVERGARVPPKLIPPSTIGLGVHELACAHVAKQAPDADVLLEGTAISSLLNIASPGNDDSSATSPEIEISLPPNGIGKSDTANLEPSGWNLQAKTPSRDTADARSLNSRDSPKVLRQSSNNSFAKAATASNSTASSWTKNESKERSGRSSRKSIQSEELNRHHLLKRRTQSKHADYVYSFLNDAESSTCAWWYSVAMPPLILLSVLFTLIQTIEDIPIKGVGAAVVETSFDVFFALEVVLRFLTCPSKCAFFASAYNMIDILAAVPPLALRISIDFVISDVEKEETIGRLLLTVVPVFRLLKSLRRFQKFLLLLSAFGLAFEALPVLLFTLGIIALVFSTLIYLVEPRDNIRTWPEALWLTIVTMTTIGYGDIVPESPAGYIVVSVLVVSSVLYMAMPLGIIGSAFTRIWRDRDRILLVQRTRDLLVQWGYTASDIPELFGLFDSDKSGELNLQEFTRMLAHMRLGLKHERVMELFESFDNDGSGSIDDEEFVRALFPAQYHDLYGSDTGKKRSNHQRPRSSKESWSSEVEVFEGRGSSIDPCIGRSSSSEPRPYERNTC